MVTILTSGRAGNGHNTGGAWSLPTCVCRHAISAVTEFMVDIAGAWSLAACVVQCPVACTLGACFLTGVTMHSVTATALACILGVPFSDMC
jgi:hypothetical protein